MANVNNLEPCYQQLAYHFSLSRRGRADAFKYTMKSISLAIDTGAFADGLLYASTAFPMVILLVEAKQLLTIINTAIDCLQPKTLVSKVSGMYKKHISSAGIDMNSEEQKYSRLRRLVIIKIDTITTKSIQDRQFSTNGNSDSIPILNSIPSASTLAITTPNANTIPFPLPTEGGSYRSEVSVSNTRDRGDRNGVETTPRTGMNIGMESPSEGKGSYRRSSRGASASMPLPVDVSYHGEVSSRNDKYFESPPLLTVAEGSAGSSLHNSPYTDEPMSGGGPGSPMGSPKHEVKIKPTSSSKSSFCIIS